MSTPASQKIILLDDHEVVRHGLAQRLSQEPGLEVSGSFGTSRDLLAWLRQHEADLLILDYSLAPGEIDGLNLIRALRVRFAKLPILVMSALYNPAMVNLTMDIGIRGFVGKADGLEVLIRAVRTILLGRIFIDPTMTIELAEVQTGGPGLNNGSHLSDHPSLSPRESEVIRCCLEGMKVRDIATKFSRSVTTISTQKTAAFRKLGIRSDAELFKIKHIVDRS